MTSNNTFNSLQHTLDIIQAALPYVGNQAKGSMNLVLKAAELVDTVKELGGPTDLSTCNIKNEKVDPEVMLLNVRDVCTTKEQEFIDMIVNFIKAKNLYHSYQSFAENTVQATTANRNQTQNPFGNGKSINLMDFLMTQISPDQKATFDSLSMLLNAKDASNS